MCSSEIRVQGEGRRCSLLGRLKIQSNFNRNGLEKKKKDDIQWSKCKMWHSGRIHQTQMQDKEQVTRDTSVENGWRLPVQDKPCENQYFMVL